MIRSRWVSFEFYCTHTSSIGATASDSHSGGRRMDREVGGDPRSPPFPPIGWLLRRQLTDVFSSGRFQNRRRRCFSRKNRRCSVLYQRTPIRLLAPHPTRHRCRPRPRQRLLSRSSPRSPLPHPLTRFQRRRSSPPPSTRRASERPAVVKRCQAPFCLLTF